MEQSIYKLILKSLMYDLNISPDYQDLNELKSYEGIAVSQKIDTDYSVEMVKLPIDVRQYHRVDFIFDQSNTNFNYRKVKSDIFCITPIDEKSLEMAISWMPDMISINRIFKISLLREIVNRNIFIEIKIREGLYNRISWLKTVSNIFKATRKNIIITSGARRFTELKKPHDVIKMLTIFDIGDEQASEIVYLNPKRLLTQCAIKRYVFNGVISGKYDGPLKEDFLNKKFI